MVRKGYDEKMKSYRPQLDGLRALAVLGVVFQHYAPAAWSRVVPWGGLGVSLFFVLSGYLITGILLRGKERLGGASAWSFVRTFYIRRALRILPVYYAALALALCAGIPPVRQTLLWHLAYLSNVYFAWKGSYCGAISPLWSLAVEQHFYLVWPWVVLAVPMKHMKTAIIAMIISGFAFRLIVLAAGWNAVARAVLTPCAFEALGCGALLAYATHRGSDILSRPNLSRIGALGALLYPAAVALNAYRPDTALSFAFNGVALGALWFWLVARAAQGFANAGGRWLEADGIVYLGKLSYGIYLFHGLAYAWISPSWNSIWPGMRAILAFGLTLAMAALSYRYFEAPLHALKRYFPFAESPASANAPRAATAEAPPESPTFAAVPD